MASYAASRVHEVEHRSASACSYHAGSIVMNGDGWTDGSMEEAPASGGDVTPCSSLDDGTTVRVAPMERARGGWDDEHFHDALRLPEGSDVGKGMVVTFEAMGRECIAVALSPTPYFSLGKTYAIHFGANGNLATVLRRRLPSGTEAVDSSFPSRVCTEDRWTPYWIVLQWGKLSAGIGKFPGKRCVGTLDDTLYNQLRSGVDAVRHVGLGNSALGRNARDIRFRNVRVMGVPEVYGMEGIPIEEIQPGDEKGFVTVDGSDTRAAASSGPTDAELLAEYERECAKARARAAKFGTEYKEPKPDAFLRWSEARRLRANPERGFITGIDTMSAEERAKAEARKERFANDKRKRKGRGSEADEDMNGLEGSEEGDALDDSLDASDKRQRDPLPVEQAWDNEELVREHRLDPPHSLHVKKLGGEVGNNGVLTPDAEGDEMAGDVEKKESFLPEKEALAVPEKIHLFAIDWAAFKQIRTPDIMSYFSVYGPSYVEWLGELSCNVLFEDKYSAARALKAMSQDIPSPPPDSVATREEGFSMEEENGGESKSSSPSIAPDLGAMGWHFCQFPVRKVANDRYGRRGTRSRVLMRLASNLDVLEERPTAWPKPPPGFTTKRVLGPGSDFDASHRRGERKNPKRRRRGSGDGLRRGYDDEYDESYDYDAGERNVESMGEHPDLSQGLRSGRAGFSVEQMEAERAAKRVEGE